MKTYEVGVYCIRKKKWIIYTLKNLKVAKEIHKSFLDKGYHCQIIY